ncbi:MAG: hypothetical protein MUC48_26460 [Leptolyngbya sp. Prado105]|nr:hypothetical protein [Leptolyngbya sp. Prado105]
MKQNRSQLLSLDGLSAIEQLQNHIQQSAMDSENTPILSDEVSTVANLVIQRLVLHHSQLDQIIQEILDNLRFNV